MIFFWPTLTIQNLCSAKSLVTSWWFQQTRFKPPLSHCNYWKYDNYVVQWEFQLDIIILHGYVLLLGITYKIYSYYATEFHHSTCFEAWNFAFVKNAAESLRSKFKNLIDLKLFLFVCLFVFFFSLSLTFPLLRTREIVKQLKVWSLTDNFVLTI